MYTSISIFFFSFLFFFAAVEQEARESFSFSWLLTNTWHCGPNKSIGWASLSTNLQSDEHYVKAGEKPREACHLPRDGFCFCAGSIWEKTRNVGRLHARYPAPDPLMVAHSHHRKSGNATERSTGAWRYCSLRGRCPYHLPAALPLKFASPEKGREVVRAEPVK